MSRSISSIAVCAIVIACHACNGDSWGISTFPIAPGHEISGFVRAVGANVTKFKVGDTVGVGCMVESCRTCDLCQAGLEQHCHSMVQTYGTPFPDNARVAHFKDAIGHHTNGGYTSDITVDQHCVFAIPEGTSSKREEAKENLLELLVLLGVLGQMAVKLAKAMNVDRVTILSRNNDQKKADAERLGCDLLVYTDEEALAKASRGTFDIVLDTVSAPQDVAKLMSTLKVGGHWILLGGVGKPFPISAFSMLHKRHCLEGSLIGSVSETQEMLEFCAQHNVVPEYEVIAAKDANAQFNVLMDGSASADRKVIDIST